MATSSSKADKLAVTPMNLVPALSPRTGSARVLKAHLSDEDLWKRLKESGFDEESIKRRDKASLIAYIAKLEAEIYEHQHHMGVLILEKKDWLSKYEEAKSMVESAELQCRRQQASHISELADAKKREVSLRKALGIEKECLKNVEKTLHEMRAEYAEVKVAAESKYAEARNMVEDANKKLLDAEDRRRAAESLESEASRYHRNAQRKLHEVEEREDESRRRMMSLKTELDDKEKEIQQERLSLSERQKAQQLAQERLLDGQALLNQREEYIFSRTQELEKFEKKLEDLKLSMEKEQKALNEEKQAMEMRSSSLSAQEEAAIKRECDLLKREEDLLLLQAKFINKEPDNVEEVIPDLEDAFLLKNSTLEAELVNKRKLVEEEINAKRRDWELNELDIRQREDSISERERDLEIESKRLQEREKEVEERSSLLEEKEKCLLKTEKQLELKKELLQKEETEIFVKKIDLKNSLDSLEKKKKYINDVEEKVLALKSETNELLTLELKLKEEIDMISAEKRKLDAEADHLKEEKAKFESEWELIDEKRALLAKEAEFIAEERLNISKFLKDERDSLMAEKNAMREKYKQDLDSLSHDREIFTNELEHERSEWFSKFVKERTDLLLDIELQKEEMDNSIKKRHEEIESELKERELEFEEEKRKELQHIAFLKETMEKELEHVNCEMKKLDSERREINLDREKRDLEWEELNNSIEELKLQRQKLERQRELLRADREEILVRIDDLKKLEDAKDRLDSLAEKEMHIAGLEADIQKSLTKSVLKLQNDPGLNEIANIENGFGHNASSATKSEKLSSPISAPFSWLKRCADTFLEPRQSSKRRRKENDLTAQLGLGTATTIHLTEEKVNTSKIEHALMAFDQPPVAAEEGRVHIGKIIAMEEITSVGIGSVIGDSEKASSTRK